jgi:hypothetical protein
MKGDSVRLVVFIYFLLEGSLTAELWLVLQILSPFRPVPAAPAS